jgi:integrase
LPERAQAGLLLVLATGVRLGELLGAAFADAVETEAHLRRVAEERSVKYGRVDAATRTWYLPDTKNGRDHTIHLSDFALRQVERLQAARQAAFEKARAKDDDAQPADWLFPARRRFREVDGVVVLEEAGPVTVASFGKQIADRQRAPGKGPKSNRAKGVHALALPGGHWTLHDLRRSAATLMADLGVSGDVIDECLNHKMSSRVRRTYIRTRREGEQAQAFNALGNALVRLEGGAAARQLHAVPRAA